MRTGDEVAIVGAGFTPPEVDELRSSLATFKYRRLPPFS
jgi:hypothetical protein